MAVERRQVEGVHVLTGDHIQMGQALITFDTTNLRGELERAERSYEFHRRLVVIDRTSQNMSDMTRTRIERDRFLSALYQSVLRAPADGRILDVRVRAGDIVSSGEILLTMGDGESEIEVVGLLPGYSATLLSEDSTLQLELDGFPHSRTPLEVIEVSDELVGRDAAVQHLGNNSTDKIQSRIEPMVSKGSMAVIRARAATGTFASQGVRYQLFDGLTGRIEAKLRLDPVYMVAIPGMRALLEGSRGTPTEHAN